MKSHGYSVHFIAVIRNGDGNVRYQRKGKAYDLHPGKIAKAFKEAAKSAEEEVVEFLCPSPVNAPSHD